MAGELRAGHAVQQHQGAGREADCRHLRGDAKPGESAKCVGADLHPGADLLNLRRALDDMGTQAAPRQRNGRAQAADARTGDQDPSGVFRRFRLH